MKNYRLVCGFLLTVLVTVPSRATEPTGASLLANGEFEQGTVGETPGWSLAFYPQLKEDIHRCVLRSDARAKSGKWSLKIDTTPVLGKDTILVFNGGLAGDASRARGHEVVLSGWVYAQPGAAVRPISMQLRVFGKDSAGQNALLTHAVAVMVVGKLGQWVQFRGQGTIPSGEFTVIDLHCSMHPDVVPTIQFLDDLRLDLVAPPPLRIVLPRNAIWRDESVLTVDAQLRTDQSKDKICAFDLRSGDGKDAAHWERPALSGLWGLALPRKPLPEGRYRLQASLRGQGSLAPAETLLDVSASPWEDAPKQFTAEAALTTSGTVPDGFRVLGTVAPTKGLNRIPAQAEPISPDLDLAEATARGYAVFHRPDLHEVSRLGRPRPGEMSDVRLFACPGQYESAPLSVWAIRAQAEARVSVGDLRGVSASIPSINVDVRVVRTLSGLPMFLEKASVG